MLKDELQAALNVYSYDLPTYFIQPLFSHLEK